MFDLNLLKSYFQQININSPFQILLKSHEAAELRQIDGYGGMGPVIPGEVPVFDQWYLAHNNINNQTSLWLKYPEESYIIVCFSQLVFLEDSVINMLYCLLFPCFYEYSSIHGQLQVHKRFNEIYKKLTMLSLRNLGNERNILELCHLTGLSLIFIDLINNGHYPRNKKVPACIHLDELNRRLSMEKKPIYLQPDKSKQAAYYIYPIISDNVCLGCFIITIKSQLSQFDEMLIELGGMVVALELIKNHSLTELYYTKAYQIFEELIQNNDPSSLVSKCDELGIDLNANYICVVFAYTSNVDLQVHETCIHRLVSRIKKELADVYQTVFCHQQKVTMLASVKSSEYIPVLKRQIEEIINHTLQSENLPLSAGMGSLYSNANNIGKTYREAIKALSYQISRHYSGLVLYSDIGINQLFINLPQEDAITFLKKIFYPLRDKSKNKDNYLEKTLLAFIDTNCSIVQTADRLFVHTNTLHQRLKKIEECLKLTFDNPEDLLQIKLACYLRRSHTDFDKIIT
jgi:sugar diacid utilization regulator